MAGRKQAVTYIIFHNGKAIGSISSTNKEAALTAAQKMFCGINKDRIVIKLAGSKLKRPFGWLLD